MQKCISELTIIGSDKGLSPGQHQDIICNNAEILLIQTLGTNFSEILSEIQTFFIQENPFENIVFEKWQPFCHSLNVLKESAACHSS